MTGDIIGITLILSGGSGAFISRADVSLFGETAITRKAMNGRASLLLGGALGFVGVALGAFGAHGLKGWLATLADGADRLAWWQTGVQYHLWHALLLVALGLWPGGDEVRALRLGRISTVAGIALFSGSLYAMTLSGIRPLGAVTPFGGLAFLAAWICVALAARRGSPQQQGPQQ
jgi:uncharacterized membrane protein YgdD (TMEM256/DUF423 family)